MIGTGGMALALVALGVVFEGAIGIPVLLVVHNPNPAAGIAGGVVFGLLFIGLIRLVGGPDS